MKGDEVTFANGNFVNLCIDYEWDICDFLFWAIGCLVGWNRCYIFQSSASLVNKLKFSGRDFYYISNVKTKR